MGVGAACLPSLPLLNIGGNPARIGLKLLVLFHVSSYTYGDCAGWWRGMTLAASRHAHTMCFASPRVLPAEEEWWRPPWILGALVSRRFRLDCPPKLAATGAVSHVQSPSP